MELSGRQANTLLVVLALGAVGASGYAMWNVRQMPEPSAQVADSPAPTTGASTTPTQDAEDGDAAQTYTHSSDDSTMSGDDEPTESSDPQETTEPAEPTLADWRSAWRDHADLLVIGDGYSNLESQWVQLWADRQAADRPTLVCHWAERADDAFNDPIELSDGEGPDLHVWSASRDGTTIREATRRIDRFIDASAPPDAVLISLGGSSGDEDVAEQLDRLLEELPDVPVLVAAGPSGLYETGVADDIVDWAKDNTDRVSLIDLREATSENPTGEEWALAFDEAASEN
ncbi:hypothetical protein SGUI_2411 [Serinicoccus hydrothermalis]|uniref:Uncharacterized protein n=1 Tax=Serinicoccus hydrothermalis TaxID=1758689 RepID=A0A1B1NED6_9MICO|nr:hypothetical protein [Serinicoccus hydrothermalis]ANS79807.1 hypothetical protein SGUI_2411 [Serinicoccus hydrothermalis]